MPVDKDNKMSSMALKILSSEMDQAKSCLLKRKARRFARTPFLLEPCKVLVCLPFFIGNLETNRNDGDKSSLCLC